MAVGTRDPVEAALRLLGLGIELAIVKQGGDGVLVATADGMETIPPKPVDVVCGLGAGDAFGGALCHRLLAGDPPAGGPVRERGRARSWPAGCSAPTRCRPRTRSWSSWRRDEADGRRPPPTGGHGRADGDPVVITPAAAGWDYCGLRVVHLARACRGRWSSAGDEAAVIPLSTVDLTAGGGRGELRPARPLRRVRARAGLPVRVARQHAHARRPAAATWPSRRRPPVADGRSPSCGRRTSRSRCAAPAAPAARS